MLPVAFSTIANTNISQASSCVCSHDGQVLAVAFLDKSLQIFTKHLNDDDSGYLKWKRQMSLHHKDGVVETMKWLQQSGSSSDYILAISAGKEIVVFQPFTSAEPIKRISSPFAIRGFCQSGIDYLMAWGDSNTVVLEGWDEAISGETPKHQIFIPMPSSIGWPLAAPFQQYRDFLTVGKRSGFISAWSIVDQIHGPKVCKPVQLYESSLHGGSYGPCMLVEKVGFSHWVVVQKNGWTLIKWETGDDEPGIHQEISADLEGVKQVVTTDVTAQSPSFGFVTVNQTFFWISEGHSQLVTLDEIDANVILDSCYYDSVKNRVVGLFTKSGGGLYFDYIDVGKWPLSWTGQMVAYLNSPKAGANKQVGHPLQPFFCHELKPSDTVTCTHISADTSLVGLSDGTVIHVESQKRIRGFTGPIIHLFQLAKEFSLGTPQPAATQPPGFIAVSGAGEVGIIDIQGFLKYWVPGHHAPISKLVTYMNLSNVLGVKYLDGSKRLWSFETNSEYTDRLAAENWEIELHCLCSPSSDQDIFVDSRDSGLCHAGSWAVNLNVLLANSDYMEICKPVLENIFPNVKCDDYSETETDTFYPLIKQLQPSSSMLAGSVSPCGTWLYDDGLLCTSSELTATFLALMVALANVIYEGEENSEFILTTLKPLNKISGFILPSPTTLVMIAIDSSACTKVRRAAKLCLLAYYGDMRYSQESELESIYNSHTNLLFDQNDPISSCVNLYIIASIARVVGDTSWINHVCAVIRTGLEIDSVQIRSTSLDCLHLLWPSLKSGLEHIVDVEAVVTCFASSSYLTSDCWAILERITSTNVSLLVTSLIFILESLSKPTEVRIAAIDVLLNLLAQTKQSSATSMEMFVPYVMHTACKMLNPDLLRHSPIPSPASVSRGVSLQTKVTTLLSHITTNFPRIVSFHKASQRLAVAICPSAATTIFDKNIPRRRSSLSELNQDLDVKVTDTSLVVVYDLRSGSEFAYLDPQEFNSNHAASVWGLVFSPDGRMIAGLTRVGLTSSESIVSQYRVVVWQIESHNGTLSSLFGSSNTSGHSSHGVYSESAKFDKNRNPLERQAELLLYASMGKIGYRDKDTPSFEPLKVQTLLNVLDSNLAISWMSETVLLVGGHKVIVH